MNTQPLSTLPTNRLPLLAAALSQPAVAGRTPSTADFSLLLDEFEPIGLAQMDAVALLDRTDTKYVMQSSQLYTSLAALSADYRVLAIDDVRMHPYRTLYFDTDDFALYMRHHASGFSKYCIGTALLYPAVKHNNFKDQLRLVGKLMGGDTYVYRTH